MCMDELTAPDMGLGEFDDDICAVLQRRSVNVVF